MGHHVMLKSLLPKSPGWLFSARRGRVTSGWGISIVISGSRMYFSRFEFAIIQLVLERGRG